MPGDLPGNYRVISKAKEASRTWPTCGGNGRNWRKRWMATSPNLSPASLEEVVYRKSTSLGHSARHSPQ